MYKIKKINFFKEKKTKKNIYINWRFFTLCIFILLSLFILTLRVFFLQIINPDPLIHEGDRRTLRIQSFQSTRGIINDRSGYPLAVTVLVNAVCMDPTIIKNKKNIKKDIRWKALSEVLSIPLKKIIFHIYKHQKSKFIYLARQITPELGQYIKKLKLPGIFLLEETKRYYPSGKITSQLVGLTNIDGVGIEGVEKSFNTYLTGKPGKRKIRKDKKGDIIENISLINRSVSNSLTLSIDKKLQTIVYHKLDKAVKKNNADSGTAVLIDIKTGEVLAMVNSPSYNPNNIHHVNKNNIRNRAITDMFEPGSTVKPIVIMEGLKLGIIKKNSIINTQPYYLNKHQIKDVSYHDQLSTTGILQKSSNVGVSKIALSMPISKLMASYIKFGLGKPTKLGLIGEKNGIFPKKKNWSNLEKATFSFGYGLMVTPLQLARVYATIGSYGIYRPLSIIKINLPVPGKRIFPKKYVKNVLHMMESVAKPGGGGIKAAVKGYRIAIKTGTAKKVSIHGHYIKEYVAYTAGIAPASDPRFSLIIMIDNPKGKKYYGGAVSAPVFGSIMKLILKEMKIQPDDLSN
ncbi:peptidoglycan glycosyltransferase FtsI [Buchnera aphidicola]|uniref:Peptidoglycan D,D-transpeptidase FtsI n=1 Tax=Buchnera aphidicola str. USDA (Myzus persicae) TaxID=1009856 RepID=W0P3Y0_BUCMP|nr:peptidoglycan glycosyltransferase FtsI [Buchnera aphidicola]AHG60152.1 Ftsi [Buchnera aphidicola str. USDA (Myzus persicae)]AHG60732.1 Ftsi [Buchnera aphidicola str. W106 (Myzus persicae)]AHG61304.1 Ftsi [Buchnera aphidicola str. G002 (Myzus persicae)]AHG61877.1 Ftsi [Buchnera aphidicola str. F009 (Myzus persicae)]WAI03157.1 MAG: peptidoglycan glycosyltransferase FtsI [Buchnera aphidicola (Myzus persicae)]